MIKLPGMQQRLHNLNIPPLGSIPENTSILAAAQSHICRPYFAESSGLEELAGEAEEC
jgi:hypothetical protein